MNTVGAILKVMRIKKGYSLEKVEQATKIRVKFLLAIEADSYDELPSVSYAKGFVKNYAEYLGLSSKDVLAFFRRQTADVSRQSILPHTMEREFKRSFFRLTPTRFLIILVAGFLVLFLSYFLYQYRRLQLPPILVIDSPVHKLVTRDKRIDIVGRTDTDASVIVNGVSVIVRSDGKFFHQIELFPGVNKISITSTSRFGKKATEIREVGLDTSELR
jgi:transcriptional regulator with XRE-family HTH domain